MCRKLFNVKLANTVVGVESIYGYVENLCKDYITEEPADFIIEIKESDVAYEREKSEQDDIRGGIPVRIFQDDYLESLAVYRKIVENILNYNIILFHGSAIALDGRGYLFVAKSGIGKSTHTRLWRELYGDRVLMINDDKPLLTVSDKGVVVYGTPWMGKHNLGANASVQLKTICFLERAEENSIKRLTQDKVYGLLLQHVYRPKDIEAMKKTMEILDRIVEQVEFYCLRCNKETEAARIAYEGMNGGL